MKSARHLMFIAIITLSLISHASVAPAQAPPDDGCEYFSETGHYVCGTFLDFFEARGDLEMFGYPLTEAFDDPTHGGLRVQYFQRARMEEHPYNPPPYDVQLGLLVDELGYAYPRASPEELPAPDDPSHHYFPETQHVVSYAFLDFYRAHDGLFMFGYPRSEMMYEEDRVVQYFQRARLEWHRERAPGEQIVLTNMGERYIERFGIPGDYDGRRSAPPRIETPHMSSGHHRYRAFLPLILAKADLRQAPPRQTAPRPTVPSPTAPSPTVPSANVTELDVSATVRYPITGRTGTQTAFIYVNDQQGRPVAGAEASVIVRYASGDVTCVAKPTDGAGYTQCSFDIPTPPVGKRVVIDIAVTYKGLTGTTQTFFMPWW